MKAQVCTLAILFTALTLSVLGCGADGGTKNTEGPDVIAEAAAPDGLGEGAIADDTIGADAEASEIDPGDAVVETLSLEQRYLVSDEYAQEVGTTLSTANTRFAVKLFQKMNEGLGAGENIFISPFSISTALAMTYNGATGETLDAMAETLEYSGIDIEALNVDYLQLIKSLEHVDEDVTLDIADSIWMNASFASLVKEAFLDVVAEFFLSAIFIEDFGDEATLAKINGWIEDNTNGKITDMLDQIPASAVMYLINALYFKADWTYPFDPEDTSERDFILSDGSSKKVQMMTYGKLVTSFAYTADADYCAVRLPYGRDKIAFYGFVPWSYDSDKTIQDFIADLTAEKLDAYINDVAYPVGDGEGIGISMPKFKIEYKETLNDVLTALGMGVAFDLGGFDKIAEALGISRVIHQTFIEVNEEGTEAAAATVVEMFSGITPSFNGDEPFFFVIRDDRSGSILFMGKVGDPTAE